MRLWRGPPRRQLVVDASTETGPFPPHHRGLRITLFDKEMKRPATIIVVLILLLAIIGFERIGRGLHLLISDDRVARARQADEATISEDTNLKESSFREQGISPIATRSQDQGQADTITPAPIEDLNGS